MRDRSHLRRTLRLTVRGGQVNDITLRDVQRAVAGEKAAMEYHPTGRADRLRFHAG